MQEKTSFENYTDGEKVAFLKKTYQKPVLKTYGLVKHLTQSAGSANGDAGAGMMPSDRAVKENIVRIDIHPLGFDLYLFDYKPAYRERCGYGRQFGVMADEIETVMPEAVSTHPDGYKMVNYAMLGITHRIK
jgi:hypothetical protein